MCKKNKSKKKYIKNLLRNKCFINLTAHDMQINED